MTMVTIMSYLIIGVTLFHILIKVKNLLFKSATIIAIIMASYWYIFHYDSVQIIK